MAFAVIWNIGLSCDLYDWLYRSICFSPYCEKFLLPITFQHLSLVSINTYPTCIKGNPVCNLRIPVCSPATRRSVARLCASSFNGFSFKVVLLGGSRAVIPAMAPGGSFLSPASHRAKHLASAVFCCRESLSSCGFASTFDRTGFPTAVALISPRSYPQAASRIEGNSGKPTKTTLKFCLAIPVMYPGISYCSYNATDNQSIPER